MKKLIIALTLLSSLSAYAKTEIVCARDTGNYVAIDSIENEINNKIERIERLQTRNEVTVTDLVISKTAGVSNNRGLVSNETICVIVNY